MSEANASSSDANTGPAPGPNFSSSLPPNIPTGPHPAVSSLADNSIWERVGEAAYSLATTSYSAALGMQSIMGTTLGPFVRSWVFGAPRSADTAFEAALTEGRAADLADLEGVFIPGYKDVEGRMLIVVVGAHYSSSVASPERLLQRLCLVLDEWGRQPYSVVYAHSGFSYSENSPGPLFLARAWETLPDWAKDNLHRLYVLHSDLSLRIGINLVAPCLSAGLLAKIEVPLRIEFIFDDVREATLRAALPEAIWRHDAELEEHPLMDYGMVAPDRTVGVPGGPTLPGMPAMPPHIPPM